MAEWFQKAEEETEENGGYLPRRGMRCRQENGVLLFEGN